ncbi:phosphoribosylanthranilate isomerase [Hippea jasoniae]|uniref:phosphoribosylanthranilate isomerase n=1 Tax=Hippea jasoniae TaxID=944479 RepID=UPI00054F136F|nr:phosphoribosylanthranilate isomerase [Hippea jasoniae]
MRVKFCGMTNLEDVGFAAKLGVDFVGFVFFKKSKRFVEPEKVKQILSRLHTKVKTVGVFVGQSKDEIVDIMNYCMLDFAQVYEDFDLPNAIRVYRIKDKLPDVKKDGFILFDCYVDSFGGAGKSFNWDLLDDVDFKDRLFVAGGINAQNVLKLKEMGVFGVDLVSSIEEYPSKKSFKKMEEFMKAVRGEQ